MMKIVISENFESSKAEILDIVQNFEVEGEHFGDGERNTIKLFDLQGLQVNVKSFKAPNFINTVMYRFFRKSKAERSFKYAQKLLKKGIGTPRPVAYIEEVTPARFQKSYYFSEHLQYDLTFRELVQEPNYLQHEAILRAFTRFTFKLHEAGVEFLDHSPGNTLIQLNNGDYKFYLVDLNRMNFKNLTFEERIKNFSRLTPKKEMVKVMASEYAKLIEKPEVAVFEKMWRETESFQQKFHRKQRLKKKLKFWK